MFDPNKLPKDSDDKIDDPHGLRGCRLDPSRFASATFAQGFPECFDDYVECRVQGIPRDVAVIEALDMVRFGIEMVNVMDIALAMDCNPYVKAKFRKVLAAKDIKTDLWSLNKAVFNLLQLIEDRSVRDTTRLNAINSLNAMCGYAALDDGLQRRVQQTLRDFDRLSAIYENGNGKGDEARLMN